MQNKLQIPEIILFDVLKLILNTVRVDLKETREEKETIFYKLFYGTKFPDIGLDFYSNAKEIFLRDKSHPRYLDIRLFFNADRAAIPTIHINLPSESDAGGGLGVDEGYNGTNYNQLENSISQNHTRAFNTIYNIIVTSDNSDEVLIIYHALRAFLISMMDILDLNGLRNPKLGGSDLQFNPELVPANIFIRNISLNCFYEITVPSIIKQKIINKIKLISLGITEETELNTEFVVNQDSTVEIVTIKGDKGEQGDKLLLQVTATHIQYRYDNIESNWINLIALEDLKGNDGKQIELGVYNNYLVWRYVGDSSWQNLINIDDLKGNDGREIELIVAHGYICWKYVGELIWNNLIALADLKGDKGDPGADTNYKNIFYVDPNGNDNTGTKGSVSKPFLTIEGALEGAIDGDLIIINAGEYEVNNNLAKDGITYYFQPGTIINKKNEGAFFDYSDLKNFTKPINILGYGSFYKISKPGEFITFGTNPNYIQNEFILNLEADVISTIDSIALKLDAEELYLRANIKINEISSYYDKAISILGVENINYYLFQRIYNTIINIKAKRIYSHSSIAIDIRLALVEIECDLVYSETIGAIISRTSNCIFKINQCLGIVNSPTKPGYYLSSSDAISSIQIIGNTNSIYIEDSSLQTNVGINLKLIGLCHYLYIKSGKASGTFYNVIQAGGTVLAEPTLIAFEVSGGILELTEGKFTIMSYKDNISIIHGGEVISNAELDAFGIINLNSGILRINHKININNREIEGTPFIRKYGGDLIFNRATLYKKLQEFTFISAPIESQNIQIGSGGLDINGEIGDLLNNKLQKDQIQITELTAGTALTINNGFENISFISNIDTSLDDIANHLVIQINSSLLNLTAVFTPSINGGLFTIEQTVYRIITYSNLSINISINKIREISFPLIDIIGGPLIENSNII